jgi:ATP-dependent protease Clp ATPase subunit
MFWPFGLACSFCHRSDDQVAKLVAGPRALLVGPRVYICDACVAISARIMEQPVMPPARPQATGWRRWFSRTRIVAA